MSSTTSTGHEHHQRGAVMMITLVLLAALSLGAMVIMVTTRTAVERARAQTAADAAALAGAAADRASAADFAQRNGARLVLFEPRPERVRVVVTVGAARGAAEAEVVWRWVPVR